MELLLVRVWHKIEKRMLYTDWGSFRNWYEAPEGGRVICGRGFDGERLVLSEPMLFTGFKAAGKVLIFDKDVIQIDIEGEKYITEVFWDDGGWSIRVEEDYIPYLGVWYAEDNIIVLGNLFENPELKSQLSVRSMN